MMDWESLNTAPRDGTMVELLVDYTDGHHPLNDALISSTIGFNNQDNDGEDKWLFAGWCWSHDHFTQGEGKVLGWRPSRIESCDEHYSPPSSQ